MNYTRRSAARRRRSKRGSAVFAVIIIGVLLYVGLAGVTGNWLANNVIKPVFSALGIWQAEQTPSPSPTPTQGTFEVEVKGFSAWFLQTGVFQNFENAKTESGNLQKKGGAGYIAADGNRYRVMLAVYNSEADAKTVKDRLEEQASLETRVHPLSAGASKTYAKTQQKADKLKQAANSFIEAANKLFDACESIDNPSNAKSLAQQAKSALQQVSDALESEFESGENDFADELYLLCEDCMVDLDKAINGDNTILSANIQLAAAKACYQYIILVQGL